MDNTTELENYINEFKSKIENISDFKDNYEFGVWIAPRQIENQEVEPLRTLSNETVKKIYKARGGEYGFGKLKYQNGIGYNYRGKLTSTDK